MRLLAATIALFVLAALPNGVFAQDVERGAVLFRLCSQCHGRDGSGNQLVGAPAIAGLDNWYVLSQLTKFRSGGRGRHFDDVEGLRMRPMSQTLRTEADVQSVAAYVASMPHVPPKATLSDGQSARGQQLYAPCSACHGAQGEGNPQVKGPPLAKVNDWYLLRQLEKFKAGVRGFDPALDPDGALMRGMSSVLRDDQSFKDVVAYIATLAK